ncbi:thioredoxin family protein [Streptomyces caeni]|uniref:Thioredoxin family protein n=1 Tax=Streptomyces caeni TaxID=2307231 RepID=A0ABW4IQW1_9ACTN
MTTIELTYDNFAEVGSSADTMVIGFSSQHCRPCAVFASLFERVSDRHDDMVFAAVDVTEQSRLADALGVASVPNLMIVRDRIVLYTQPGTLPERVLESLLDKVNAVDMDDLRRRMTARGPSPAQHRAPSGEKIPGAKRRARRPCRGPHRRGG